MGALKIKPSKAVKEMIMLTKRIKTPHQLASILAQIPSPVVRWQVYKRIKPYLPFEVKDSDVEIPT